MEEENKAQAVMFDVTEGPYKCRQVGRFEIKVDLISDPETFDNVQLIMAEVVVFRAEEIPFEDTIRYWAISKKFRPVEPGARTPWYEVLIHRQEEPPLVWIEWKETKREV